MTRPVRVVRSGSAGCRATSRNSCEGELPHRVTAPGGWSNGFAGPHTSLPSGPVTLDEAFDELYGVTPGEFVATRKALAKQLRGDGDAAGAKELGGAPADDGGVGTEPHWPESIPTSSTT